MEKYSDCAESLYYDDGCNAERNREYLQMPPWSPRCCKLKKYTVRGIFAIETEAYDERAAKEKAGRILQADGIGYSIVEVLEVQTCQ